jgi:hypothetical protein
MCGNIHSSGCLTVEVVAQVIGRQKRRANEMKDFLKTVAGITIFIVLAVATMTIIRNINRQPSMILTSTVCEPPCWYGIHPGQTDSSQVYLILAQISGVDGSSVVGIDDGNNNVSRIYWFFQRPVEDISGTVYFSDDKATAISIVTANTLKLATLFEKLGQPEEYWTEYGQDANSQYLEIFLLYPTKGYLVDVVIDVVNSTDHVKIQAGTPVFRVTYFSSNTFQELLGTRILFDNPESVHADDFQPWTGYGDISFKR